MAFKLLFISVSFLEAMFKCTDNSISWSLLSLCRGIVGCSIFLEFKNMLFYPKFPFWCVLQRKICLLYWIWRINVEIFNKINMLSSFSVLLFKKVYDMTIELFNLPKTKGIKYISIYLSICASICLSLAYHLLVDLFSCSFILQNILHVHTLLGFCINNLVGQNIVHIAGNQLCKSKLSWKWLGNSTMLLEESIWDPFRTWMVSVN